MITKGTRVKQVIVGKGVGWVVSKVTRVRLVVDSRSRCRSRSRLGSI